MIKGGLVLISCGAEVQHCVYQANPGIIPLKVHYDGRQPVYQETLGRRVSVAQVSWIFFFLMTVMKCFITRTQSGSEAALFSVIRRHWTTAAVVVVKRSETSTSRLRTRTVRVCLHALIESSYERKDGRRSSRGNGPVH